MHGVTPESVQRELMDAGFQVERTQNGKPPRVHGGSRPRHLTRPDDSGVVSLILRSPPATTPESIYRTTPESSATTPESFGPFRSRWNFLRRRPYFAYNAGYGRRRPAAPG